MYNIFKSLKTKVTPANLSQVIKTYTGTPLTSIKNGQQLIPPTFKLHQQGTTSFIRRQHQFLDFKQAFAFFNFVASTFNRFHYNPRIFNVYNKVIIDFTDPASNVPTTKEAFLARYLFELENNPLNAAARTLEDLNSEYKV